MLFNKVEIPTNSTHPVQESFTRIISSLHKELVYYGHMLVGLLFFI